MSSSQASNTRAEDGPFGFCDFCGGRGHHFQNCPSGNSPLCFRCGRTGHFMLTCKLPYTTNKCTICRGVGHREPKCGNTNIDDDEYRAFNRSHCHRCGGGGHYIPWCESQSRFGYALCLNCGGDDGHNKYQCTRQSIAKCGMCQGVGHEQSVCNNIAYYVIQKCDNCGNEGHLHRECVSKNPNEYTAWKGYKHCATCGKDGHFTGTCGNYVTR